MLATTLTVLLLLAPEGCVVAKELVHKPLGLVTVPNKYGVIPAGGMSNARNVCLRDPGILSSLPATRAYRADIMSSSYVIRKMYAAGASMLAFGDNSGAWQARWVTGSASTAITTTPAGLSAATFDVAQINVVKARERYFVTSLNDGVLALDSEGDTTVRAAGLRAPMVFYAGRVRSVGTTDATCLYGWSAAGWRFVWRRKHSDGYETASEPSTSYKYITYESVGANVYQDPIFIVKLTTSAGYVAGDFVDTYRTKSSTNDGTSTPEVGDTYYASQAYQLTSTDISNGYATIRERANDAQLGEELYTNPGIPAPAIAGVSNTNVNAPPGLATDTWTFKDRTFYAIRRLPSFFKTRISSFWGVNVDETSSSYAQRLSMVGSRSVTATATNGSSTLTSASPLQGVTAGQWITCVGPSIFGGSYRTITAVGATTITLDAPASNSGTAAFHAIDVLEINGVKGSASSLSALFGAHNVYDTDEPASPFNGVAQGCVLFADQAALAAQNTATVDDIRSTLGTTMVFRQGRYGDGVLTIRGTSAGNYSPPIADIAATATNGDYDERFNRLQWSKDSQPEAVVPQAELVYGHGTHYRGIPTLDATWLFASDGLWRMSGRDDTYRVDPVDSKLVLAGRNAVALLGQRIYAYTERGLVRISDGGIEEIARPVINNLIPGAAYADTWDTFVTADELHREIWLSFRSGGSTTSYVYSEVSGAFVDVVDSEWSAAEYAPYLRSMVLGVVSAQPDLYYFELDTSTTRMANADGRFQPFTLGDAFALKEWQDVNFIFEGVGSAMTLVPRFGATNYNARTVPVNAIESRCRVSVPRNAPALSARITPGFTFSAGGTTNLWSLRGISVSAIGAGDEVRR